MSSEELAKLEEQERELSAQLARVRTERLQLEKNLRELAEAEERRKEQERLVRMTIERLTSSGELAISFDSHKRTDILEALTATEGRNFNRYQGLNYIPLRAWKDFFSRYTSLPNVEVEFSGVTKEEIDRQLDAHAWTISIAREIEFQPFRISNSWKAGYLSLYNFPGIKEGKGFWTIPKAEGWRIPEFFKDIEDVEYTQDAIEEIKHQIERREKLNLIAQKEDSDDERLELLTRNVTLRGKTGPLYKLMLPYQRVNVEFALENGGRMLNGDDTGLGKTLESIAFCEIKRALGEFSQILCAVKPANLENWKREIRNLTGEEPVVCKTGIPDAYATKEIVFDRKPYVLISHDTLALYNSVGTGETRKIWNALTNEFDEVEKKENVYTWPQIFAINPPDALIIDEAQKIKNSSTHRFQSIKNLKTIKCVIPMTATPVINRTQEFWTILHMIDPELFPYEDRFVDQYVDTWTGGPKHVEKFHELLRPIMLRRRKKDVFKDLPPINRITEYRPLSDRATYIYQKILMGIYETLKEFDACGVGGQEMSIMTILAQITRLKQVCAADMVDHTVDFAQDLMDANENGGKVLIFSHFKGTANTIARKLGDGAVCTVKRTETGFTSLNAQQRDQLFEDARGDESVKYIVTTEAANEGHNLEFCDWVIFNDLWWTPAGHEQAEGRAYGRASNPHSISAYYMTSTAKIIEWIRQLLEQKMQNIEAAVEGVEASRASQTSVANELIEMMMKDMREGGSDLSNS